MAPPPPNRRPISSHKRLTGRETPLVSKPKAKFIASPPAPKRPGTPLLTSAATRTVRLDLPHGCFNAGLVPAPHGGYVCVYRPNEQTFTACLLDAALKVIPDSHFPLGLANCADPRLIWTRQGLLMIYSSHDTGSFKNECIRAAVIAHGTRFGPPIFTKPEPWRVSQSSETRQKNWTPFQTPGRDDIFLVASTRPHLVYRLREPGMLAELCSEYEWQTPWIYPNDFLRGNTNAVQLDDGTFLGTFHTAVKLTDRLHFYDNGCYVFEGKPPFKVLRCSNRTYLPAEAAVEPHFRKAGIIKVCFPISMIREGDKLLISYGDNDSSVKIMETTLADMLATTVPIY